MSNYIKIECLPPPLINLIHEYYFPSITFDSDLLNDMCILWNFDSRDCSSELLGWSRNGIVPTKSQFVQMIDGIPKTNLKHDTTLKIFNETKKIHEELNDSDDEFDDMRRIFKELGKFYINFMNIPILHNIDKLHLTWKQPGCSNYIRSGKFKDIGTHYAPFNDDYSKRDKFADLKNSPYHEELIKFETKSKAAMESDIDDLTYEEQKQYDQLCDLENKWIIENDVNIIKIEKREVLFTVFPSSKTKSFTVQDILTLVRNIFAGPMYHTFVPRLKAAPQMSIHSDGNPIMEIMYVIQ